MFVRFQNEVTMEAYRCPTCGVWWACEKSGSCPRCKSLYRDELRDRLVKANRSNAALRGQLKRLKGERRK